MSKRSEMLQQRIIELSSLIEIEQKGDNCKTYIDDCKLSIEACQRQLKTEIKNPMKEFVIVN